MESEEDAAKIIYEFEEIIKNKKKMTQYGQYTIKVNYFRGLDLKNDLVWFQNLK